jgi:lipopolysaccharide export system permease protein
VDDIEQRINTYRVEVHKKYSIPAACIAFVLVGAPLGMRARRSGVGVAFLSLAFFLFYYLCLIGGEELADRRLLPPGAAMWTPNVLLALLGIALLIRASGVRVPSLLPRRDPRAEGARG